MVKVPAGVLEFKPAGAPDGQRLNLGEFRIDRTEVTVAQYAACVERGQCTAPATDWKTCNWAARDTRGNHPVNCVSWDQASQFCMWMNKQLPSEEQWEMAARGTDGREYPWKDGDFAGKVCVKAEAEGGTCPAGSYAMDRSPSGVMDMAANVKEWTMKSETMPDRSVARVYRGGSWQTAGDGPRVKVTERGSRLASEFGPELGFRCVTAGQ